MLPKRVRVIKNHGVEVSGSVRIGPSSGPALVRNPTSVRTSSAACAVSQQARIVESNTEYAIIEITCSCGSKSHVQCNYGGA